MDNLNFTAIDFETATFDRSSICEIGIAVVHDSSIVEKKSWLVKPKYNYYDRFHIDIYGITPEMTKNSQNFKTVWKEVLPYLDGSVVVSHNTAFDMYTLKDALDEAKLEYPNFDYFCSMRVARYIIDSYSYSLDALCDKLAIQLENHHRAGDDAAACANIFIAACKLSGTNSLAEIQEKYEFKHGCFSKDDHSHKPQLSTKKSGSANLKVGDIVGDPEKAAPSNYIYGKSVCLTGTMSFGERKSILQTIADVGGIPMNSVTKKTDILVVGTQDYKRVGDSGMSSKQKKAMEMRDKGADIEIMSEKDFLNIVQLPELQKASEEEFARRLAIAERKVMASSSGEVTITTDIADIIEKLINEG